ncbi:hypothetical protein I317_02530 [Kwoniella heveanensis CBS 569]|nr:hypothetical protein I317_02530 [Kwoniella heveanensis CBS 569]
MIVPVLIASALLARSVYGAAYIGCIASNNIPTTASDAGSGFSLDECLSECSGSSYAYYDLASSSCFCDSVENTGSNFVQAQDSNGACASDQAAAWELDTPLGFKGCASRTESSSTESSTASSASECFSRCSTWASAAFTRFGGLYFCLCADRIDVATAQTCQAGDANVGFYVYGQDIDVPTGGTQERRKLKERAKRALTLKHQNCPPGLVSCRVGDHQDAFECVDIKSDLESCGGCTTGLYGVVSGNATRVGKDCNTLTGVAMGAVTCTRGQCEVSACKYGYVLIDNECVRMQ